MSKNAIDEQTLSRRISNTTLNKEASHRRSSNQKRFLAALNTNHLLPSYTTHFGLWSVLLPNKRWVYLQLQGCLSFPSYFFF